jgi:hypothetical protein
MRIIIDIKIIIKLLKCEIDKKNFHKIKKIKRMRIKLIKIINHKFGFETENK